jgi:hypothetical protein
MRRDEKTNLIVLERSDLKTLTRTLEILSKIRDDYPGTEMYDSMARGITTIVALKMDVKICSVD